MAEMRMYVIMLPQKGLFLIQPVPGKERATAIEDALGVKSGYSAGEIDADLPEGAAEAWVAWVEGVTADGGPYFLFRTFDGALSEEEMAAILKEANEEPLKLNKTEIHWAPASP